MTRIPNFLFESFGVLRRGEFSSTYLKENAEFLSILTHIGYRPAAADLAHYASLYERADLLIECFPQYYRMICSLLLDLDDLGIGGDAGTRACDAVLARDLYRAETSDMRRLDTIHMLSRRDRVPDDDIAALHARVMGYLCRPAAFRLPDRSAAYGVTHFVFYLTDFGKRPLKRSSQNLNHSFGANAAQHMNVARALPLSDVSGERQDALIAPPELIQNLMDIGALARIDHDIDLLAELCLSLRFVGAVPPSDWEDDLAHALRAFTVTQAPTGATAALVGSDDYHTFLVLSWLNALRGQPFGHGIGDRPFRFARSGQAGDVLEEVTQNTFLLRQMGVAPSPEARAALSGCFSDTTRAELANARQTASGARVLDALGFGYV